MSDEISFQLFGEGGFINPTPWSYAETDPSCKGERWGLLFYDAATDRFIQKQASDFDGGWRWFDAYDECALTIYNRHLDRRAYFLLSHTDIENSPLRSETLLMWAKSMVAVDHNHYTSMNWLEDHIRAMARRATIEVIQEIRGDSDDRLHKAHLRSV